MNLHPKNPTYFLVAGKGQLELMNSNRVTPIEKDGSIPSNQPRFISSSFGAQVRHMVACIGCDFVEKPNKEVAEIYKTTPTQRGGLEFNRLSIKDRYNLGNGRVHYLRVLETGRVFALLSI